MKEFLTRLELKHSATSCRCKWSHVKPLHWATPGGEALWHDLLFIYFCCVAGMQQDLWQQMKNERHAYYLIQISGDLEKLLFSHVCLQKPGLSAFSPSALYSAEPPSICLHKKHLVLLFITCTAFSHMYKTSKCKTSAFVHCNEAYKRLVVDG